MSETVAMPKYEAVADALVRVGALMTAAHAHGLLCGFICAGVRNDGVSWLQPVLGHLDVQEDKVQSAKIILIELYDYSCKQLHEMAFEFQLLLPDDKRDLALRAQELGHWCDGFVSGLGQAGLSMDDGTSEETRDALLHFSEIANIDYDHVDITEQDEKAYMEVVEYARMAALMVFSEFAMQAASSESKDDDSDGDGKTTLH